MRCGLLIKTNAGEPGSSYCDRNATVACVGRPVARGFDGTKVAEAHIPKTQPFAFSADEGADVGLDGETNVSPDYKQGDNKFTGHIVKVTIDAK